ncbi:Fe-S cluster assembly sulfur transfer protein SufU [Allobaculum stercoricanis]|uniref:Fe-S cluster assembly sulfur transfer protein SufU n=1 Tax=Allobaculum stercoricanis TaxID=174709 RepID=UPI0003621773|nr:SUF system NifU family Fe-S cluster assembly protein [Allobaculum stercoricanis]
MPIDPSYYREIIMDNYSYPQNKELKTDDGEYDQRHMASDSCIDDITVQAKIKDGIVQDVRFDGQACTISTASTSILTQLVANKTVEQAEAIIQNYFNMIHGRPFDPELVDEAIVFEGVAKQPNRIGCATIGWKALEEMLQAHREQTTKEQEA